MLEVTSKPALLRAAHDLVYNIDLPSIPLLPVEIPQVESAQDFAFLLIGQLRDHMTQLICVEGLPGAGKTFATQALEAHDPNTLVYPMDWRIQQPETMEERRSRLFEDFSRLYCADGKVVNELKEFLFNPEGNVLIENAYIRHPGNGKPWEFQDLNRYLSDRTLGRRVIFEGAGVRMLTHQMKKMLSAEQSSDLEVVYGLVMVDVRTTILSALLRDMDSGRFSDVEGLKKRAHFRVQDTLAVFQERGLHALMNDPPSDLVVLNNQSMMEELIGKVLDQTA